MTHLVPTRWILVSAVAVAVAASGCSLYRPKVWVEQSADLHLPVADVVALDVRTDNGAARFDAEAGLEEIHVRVRKKAGGATREDAMECMDAIEIVSHLEGDVRHLGWRWSRSRRSGWQANVSFEVRLPDHLRVAAATHNGPLALAGLASHADLETHNGQIAVNGHAGGLDARTHNGRIEIEGVVDDLHLETHNGSIRSDLSGSRVVNGTVTTHNGAVRLRLGESASLELACRTHNGRIRAASLERKHLMKKNHLRATFGGGEGSLEVTTYNGSITLR